MSIFIQSQVLCSFEGGPEVFLTLNSTSFIRGFESLQHCLRIHASPSTNSALLEMIQEASDNTTFTYEGMFHEFLRGTGVPCPGLFEDACSTFSSIVDLSLIDESAFSSRMLCWAATGSQLWDSTTEHSIEVSQKFLYDWMMLNRL